MWISEDTEFRVSSVFFATVPFFYFCSFLSPSESSSSSSSSSSSIEMERQTIKKPFNGNKATETTSHHYVRSFEQKNTIKDASFSSYLTPQPPVPKPQDNGFSVDDSDQISVFEAENYFSEKDHEQKQNNNKKRDSESTTVNHDKTAAVQRCEFSGISRLSSVSSTDGYGYGGKHRTRSFHATPTASSEASWNSQTGLLSNPKGSIPISLRNIPSDNNHTRRNGGNSSNPTKWFLGLKCPCYGKNSVQVEENLSEPKTSSLPKRHSPKSTKAENQSIQSHNNSIVSDMVEITPDFRPFSSENHFPSPMGHQHRRRRRHEQGLGSFHDGVAFSFPILNQSLSKVQAPISVGTEEPPRQSLEVFQPPNEFSSRDSMEYQQRRGFGYPASPISRLTGTEDDGASDASSDLFEIESFSTQTTYHRRDSLDEATALYGRRQSLDEPVTPSVAATECYEPSEASINWSVTTAEGFDRGSVTNFSISASEFGDVANMRRQEVEKTSAGDGWSKRRSGGGGGGNGGGLLLSCRWEKAVSLGPTEQQGKWGQEDRGGRRAVGGGGGGGPPLPLISTTRHVSSRPYKR